MPPGDPTGPEPADSVRDQVMRTISNVRTRLRGPEADEHDEEFGDGNGHGAVPLEEAPPAPMDPLLADPPSNGHAYDEVVIAPAQDTVVEAPPAEADPATEPVEAVGPAVAAGAATGLLTGLRRAPRPARPPRQRRQRVRPALPLLRRRPRVRKVSRIIRRVDAWGVFKISLVFYVILYIILLVAGVLLWNLANTTGTVANVEGFARDLFGLETFEFDGEKLFRASWVLGAILVIAGTGLNVTLAVLFNLISDLVGGVRVTVLEEEVVLRERPILPRPDPEAEVLDPIDPAGELAPPGFPLPPPEVVDAAAPAATSVEPPQNAGL